MTSLPTYSNASILGSAVSLHASDTREHAVWLASALSGHGLLNAVPLEQGEVRESIGQQRPKAVFIDFSGNQAESAAQLASALRRAWPDLVLIAMGHSSQTQTTLAALRSGVDDFVDLDSPGENVVPLLRERLAQREQATPPKAKGRKLALLCARAGLGTTTIACNLAASLQRLGSRAPDHRGTKPATTEPKSRQGVALLDLGLPACDGMLYMGLKSSFSFVDGVQNQHRLDQTLLETALAHHAGGTAVLPLPSDLGQIREISQTQSASFSRRLADFFDLQILDLGGFTSVDFLAQMTRQADLVWVVCDQSLGGIVSTASLLRELHEREVDTAGFSLVVNRFDPAVDLPAQDIALQLELPVAHVLPSRQRALLAAATRGKLVIEAAPADPWSQAIGAMARELLPWVQGGEQDNAPRSTGRPSAWLDRWLRPWKTQG